MWGIATIKGQSARFGFADFQDWLDSVILSFPAPWRVGDLDGKYYGTEIMDASGAPVLSVWIAEGAPSVRERRGMSNEEWAEYCCDSHWESELAFSTAQAIVAARNNISASDLCGDVSHNILRSLVGFCRWDSGVFDLIRCGGPERRALAEDAEIRDQLEGK